MEVGVRRLRDGARAIAAVPTKAVPERGEAIEVARVDAERSRDEADLRGGVRPGRPVGDRDLFVGVVRTQRAREEAGQPLVDRARAHVEHVRRDHVCPEIAADGQPARLLLRADRRHERIQRLHPQIASLGAGRGQRARQCRDIVARVLVRDVGRPKIALGSLEQCAPGRTARGKSSQLGRRDPQAAGRPMNGGGRSGRLCDFDGNGLPGDRLGPQEVESRSESAGKQSFLPSHLHLERLGGAVVTSGFAAHVEIRVRPLRLPCVVARPAAEDLCSERDGGSRAALLESQSGLQGAAATEPPVA